MSTSRGDSSPEPFKDSDAPNEGEEEAKDTSETLEFKGHYKGPMSASSTPGRFECNPAPPSKDATDGRLVAPKSSAMIPAANNKEASNRSLTDAKSRVHDKHVCSEDKECSESLIDGKVITLSSEKKVLNTQDAKNSNLEAYGSRPFHLRYSGSVGSETNTLLQAQSKEIAKAYVVDGTSTIGNPSDSLEKDVPHLHPKSELNRTDDSCLSCLFTPQRRPRSSSPGASPENLSKRPAMVCAFYAKGWCIRGKSCPFLHQEASQEGLAESSVKGDILDNTGSKGESERLSSSQERPDSSNTESSSKSQSQILRALVRQYGGEGHGSPHFQASSSIHPGEEFHRVDIPRVEDALSRDKYMSPFRVRPPFELVDERRSANEQFLSRRYLNEGKLQLETPKREFLNNSLFSGGSSLTTSLAGDSSTSSSLYLTNNPFARDRSVDFAFCDPQGTFPLHGSHSNYNLTSTLDSSFQFSSDRLNVHRPFDFDRGYHSSRSVSLPRSNSSSRKAQESSWEPSEPFQPSFHWAPASLSSRGGLYNPFHDSIVPHDAGNVALQASERISDLNVAGHFTDGNPLLNGNHMTEYDVQKSSFSVPHEMMLDDCTPPHGPSSQTTLGAASGHPAVDGGNSSLPRENKPWIPDHAVESADATGSENGNIDLKHQEEMARISKESKAMRIFRTILVDFVKDLVKPSWQKGQVSKGAHKVIVKKTVEKVLGALQPHEVPNTSDSINQYLSTSRPKLLKLVEGYIGKYGNS